ncbi:aspartate aminotransferase family protein [Bacillus sp. AGMB 02131]|uniref:Aspartate aminotransferase family protein n=1 Tax=Peribacillus faecalis TaxID=2772559 RepID=A0A927D1M3_9BACI|nr:aspartate aminotransferase family protein [Peribacillus faecalis]MBD3109845.1 aspartate aminotransferase family protein [Peribacillus faecalis]
MDVMASSLIKPLLHHTYSMIDYGKGVFLYDEDGKDFLDASSGAITANIGHGVEEIKEAIVKQLEKVAFVYRSQFTNEPAEQLALKIDELTSRGLKYSFFVNSGSEATETALKIALQYWQEKGQPKKTQIISRWMSYHGITLGALSMSGHTVRRDRFVSLLESYPSISPPYCYRCPFNQSYPSCNLLCATELQSMIRKIGKDNVAAFICEPVIGAAGGAIPAPDGYLQKLKQICEQNNVLFISDEVMTGVGRTGTMLACEQWDIVPDIVALGKGMSGGYTPIAAALVSEKVMEPILNGSGSVMSGHTFSANPLSCAASLAVISYIEKNNIMQQVKQKGVLLQTELKKLQTKYAFIGDVRGKGLLLGLEFVQCAHTKQPMERELNFGNAIVEIAHQHGLLLYPAQAGIDGVIGDAVLVAPPLTITFSEIHELIKRLDLTLAACSEYIQSAQGGTK